MFNKKMNPEHDDMSTVPSGQSREETSPPTPPPPGPGKPAATTPSKSSSSSSSTTPAGASTVLAEGSRFTGTANVAGTFRVEGNAEGEIDAADNFVVGKTGDVEAKVNTRRAVLNGHFRGKIEASDRVELQSGSRVEADIKARNMVMEDGVQFRGDCQIGG
jgi:cytoskeletal protein CcmA (bactofilin family)